MTYIVQFFFANLEIIQVEAGEGRVYKCLFDHKFDRLMSQGCRDALKIRQEFIMEKDYKVNLPLKLEMH